jgi:hypothetical protein
VPGPGIPEAPTDGAIYGRGGSTPAWSGVLPLTGGTVTGPLNVTATGANTVRSVQAHFGDVVNVKDFGVTGNGTTYDTAAIQAAANAVPAGGGMLYLPAGTYLTNGTVILKSNTMVRGDGPGSVLLGGSSWPTAGGFFINQNNTATTLTDSNIAICDLALDFGTSGKGGGAHAVDFIYVRTVKILNVVLQCRGAGDAIALLGCYDTLIDGCTAYGFTNCAYDHWTEPKHARVVNCYAETATSAQMVNFNPENTALSAPGNVADGFVLANCELVTTGANAIPSQLEPLGAGTSVRNVTVTGNIFRNCNLVMRRDTRTVTISDNDFVAVAGGNSVITTFAADGGTPTDFVITGNNISDPATTAGNLAVIRVGATDAVILGNRISGSTFAGVSGIDTSSFAALVLGNSVSNGLVNTPNAVTGSAAALATYLRAPAAIGGTTPAAGAFTTLGASGVATLSGGVTFGSTAAANVTDLSKHIALFGTNYGFNFFNSNLNIVSGGAITFEIAGAQLGYVNGAGMTLNAGFNMGSMLAGTTSDMTRHISLFGTAAGFNVTSGRLNIVNGGGVATYVVVNGADRFGVTATGLGFNGTAPVAKPTVSGAKGSNAALASLMTALAAYGLVTDSTTA